MSESSMNKFHPRIRSLLRGSPALLALGIIMTAVPNNHASASAKVAPPTLIVGVPSGDPDATEIYGYPNPPTPGTSWKNVMKHTGMLMVDQGDALRAAIVHGVPNHQMARLRALVSFAAKNNIKLAMPINILLDGSRMSPKMQAKDPATGDPLYIDSTTGQPTTVPNNDPLYCLMHDSAGGDPANAGAMLRNVQLAGGIVDQVQFDEPWWQGIMFTHDAATKSNPDKGLNYGCHYTIAQVLAMVKTAVDGINSYNKNPYLTYAEWIVQGRQEEYYEAETTVAAREQAFEEWEAALPGALGQPVSLFINTVAYDLPNSAQRNAENIQVSKDLVTWLNTVYRPTYNAKAVMLNDCMAPLNWTGIQWGLEAQKACETAERLGMGSPDIAIFRDWYPQDPGVILPETTKGTLTNDMLEYLNYRTHHPFGGQ